MTTLFNPQASIWTFSFRPFFLGTALHAMLAILIWIFFQFSNFSPPYMTVSIQFHIYEMVFGFARAAILGFLFTAAQNWTKTVLLKEKSLIALFLLWLVGRFGFLSNSYLSSIAFSADVLCDILALYYLLPALLKKGQEHNRIIAFIYGVFCLLHVSTVFSVINLIPSYLSLHLIHISIFVILFIIIIIAGRIIPFFTSVAIPASFPQKFPKLEQTLQYFGVLLLFEEFFLFWVPKWLPLSGGLCFIYAVLNAVRWLYWKPWKSARTPILLILHLGYFWIVIGLLVYSSSRFGLVSSSPAYHVLTTGAIGVFIYGMITRVSLGHTGRPIHATKLTILGYVFINLTVLVRGFLPIFGHNREAYILSALFWILSFLIFSLQYTNILIQPRMDARPTPP
ncbi:NnrS protein [Leptospira fainei serovar Hurstbridge str. BUT 6]|uniref:NnrS protein n=1 Tax=Leptospira fainei serovar Hurstbridge str. BUT 6 TaxID=1193011 RepID=S3UPS4_9LEPT|nr:NnrS family protein [Leptospira fainei]EPG72406.1 NnrS protein [Leptospira fainei serovar Hurstbridge str. BUT 6]